MHKNRIMEKTDKPLPERFISMSNALARSAQGLTLAEKRIVSLSLAKTDSKPSRALIESLHHNGFAIHITAEEYAREFDIDKRTAYQQLEEASGKLITRHVRTMSSTPKGLKEVLTNWCSQSTYHHGEGWIEIVFTPQISPHLLGLREKFITYRLKQVAAMRSIYSWRLYECLLSWGDKGQWIVPVQTFGHAMDLPPSLMTDFGQMRRRVLEPALKELAEKDNLQVDLALEKYGRKVQTLRFRFEVSPQGKLDLNVDEL